MLLKKTERQKRINNINNNNHIKSRYQVMQVNICIFSLINTHHFLYIHILGYGKGIKKRQKEDKDKYKEKDNFFFLKSIHKSFAFRSYFTSTIWKDRLIMAMSMLTITVMAVMRQAPRSEWPMMSVNSWSWRAESSFRGITPKRDQRREVQDLSILTTVAGRGERRGRKKVQLGQIMEFFFLFFFYILRLYISSLFFWISFMAIIILSIYFSYWQVLFYDTIFFFATWDGKRNTVICTGFKVW